jgi:hypothetical protein
MNITQIRNWARRYQIALFLFLLVAVQSGAAVLVSEGLIRRGFFEWSFMAKPGLALLFAWFLDGNKGFFALAKPLGHFRVHPVWYLFSIASLPFLLWISVYVHWGLYGDPNVPVRFDYYYFYTFSPGMYFSMTMMSIADELAFFGFVYARLAPRFTGLIAAQITAACWTFSYTPRLFMHSEMLADATLPFWLLHLNFMALAPICAWLYGSTKSAFLVVILQVAANFATLAMPILPVHTGTLSTYVVQSLVMGVGTIILVRMYGARHLTRSGQPLGSAPGLSPIPA